VASKRWLSIKVELLSGRGMVLEHPASRVMIVSTGHTLAEFAEAIDLAFARWDDSHLHLFEFSDGRQYMLCGSEFEPEVIDSTTVTLDALDLQEGASFEYVFDLGDDWRHRCEVQSVDVDPAKAYGVLPDTPVPIWGQGLDSGPVRPHRRRRVGRLRSALQLSATDCVGDRRTDVHQGLVAHRSDVCREQRPRDRMEPIAVDDRRPVEPDLPMIKADLGSEAADRRGDLGDGDELTNIEHLGPRQHQNGPLPITRLRPRDISSCHSSLHASVCAQNGSGRSGCRR